MRLFFQLYVKKNLLLGFSSTIYSCYLIVKERSFSFMVGLGGLEPPTPSLSGTYSNQLSYKPT